MKKIGTHKHLMPPVNWEVVQPTAKTTHVAPFQENWHIRRFAGFLYLFCEDRDGSLKCLNAVAFPMLSITHTCTL